MRALLLATLSIVVTSATALLANETDSIKATIMKLMQGIDHQEASMLYASLLTNAGIFATNPAGDSMVSVSAETFVELHASKKFGGQTRSVLIERVDVTEDLIAAAKVVAFNDEVHYTYYLGLVKVNGEWMVQTFLQRSRPK